MPLKVSKLKLAPSQCKPELFCRHLGYTLYTNEEFETYVNSCLCKRFAPAKFDVATNNCNCFSNAASEFLTGRGIPEEVLNLPELILGSSAIRMFRPFLNGWLGGYTSGTNANDNGN